ncbi:phosphoribosylanthranilate isomerase [Persephonella sp.]
MKDYIIKVCGLTDKVQAEETASAGATHIGMIFFEKSPRHIPLKKIEEIADRIREKALSVAVVVNPEEKVVNHLLEIVDIVQLHGDENLEFTEKFSPERVIKAFRLRNMHDIHRMEPFYRKGYTLLIDAFSEKQYGGTGKQISPEIAVEAVKQFPRTVLSGGLSDENIEDVLQAVKPYGVDASSKLELKPGYKDMEKTVKFIQKARKFYESDN